MVGLGEKENIKQNRDVMMGHLTEKILGECAMLREEISDRVVALRTERKMSQAALGEVIGKSYSVVSKKERGEQDFTPDELERLARFFSVSPNYLFGWEESEPPGLTLSREESRMLKLFRGCTDQGRQDLLESAVDCYLESKN